jgi:hypothetical protein
MLHFFNAGNNPPLARATIGVRLYKVGATSGRRNRRKRKRPEVVSATH